MNCVGVTELLDPASVPARIRSSSGTPASRSSRSLRASMSSAGLDMQATEMRNPWDHPQVDSDFSVYSVRILHTAHMLLRVQLGLDVLQPAAKASSATGTVFVIVRNFPQTLQTFTHKLFKSSRRSDLLSLRPDALLGTGPLSLGFGPVPSKRNA